MFIGDRLQMGLKTGGELSCMCLLPHMSVQRAEEGVIGLPTWAQRRIAALVRSMLFKTVVDLQVDFVIASLPDFSIIRKRETVMGAPPN